MLLAIDIGNTNIVLGVWGGDKWRAHWRLRTVHDRTADELGIYLKGLLREHELEEEITRVIMSSVVPQLTQTFMTVSIHYLHHNPLFVHTGLDLGIRNCTDVPGQVGTDRLLNASAAYERFKKACIIVDMGTATKLDVVTSQGDMIGGVISPGLGITADALFKRAAKLSPVDYQAPPATLGRNTAHAIQSGLVFGYLGLVEGLIPRLIDDLKNYDPLGDDVHIVGTGGWINVIAPHTDMIKTYDPWLTLEGLKIVAERNQ
ncbi:MAG: type III pantothenate kinase [Ardenticatenaceae bacterium]|nr:type III pantothenate kinase [Ardenticatenaceae bacterium]